MLILVAHTGCIILLLHGHYSESVFCPVVDRAALLVLLVVGLTSNFQLRPIAVTSINQSVYLSTLNNSNTKAETWYTCTLRTGHPL